MSSYDARYLPVPATSNDTSLCVPKRPWWTPRAVAKATSRLKMVTQYANAEAQCASALKACADARFEAARSLARLDDLSAHREHWRELAWIERDIEIKQARARHAQTLEQLQAFLPAQKGSLSTPPSSGSSLPVQTTDAIRRTLANFPDVSETSRDTIALVLAGLVEERSR